MVHLLCVCEGNVCRSPAFVSLAHASPLGVTAGLGSAGIVANPGDPLDPGMASALAARDVPPVEHRAQRLTPQVVQSADLVLAMTRHVRSAVVDASPAHVRRTFTLKELARIADRIESADALGDGPAARWTNLIRHASILRLPPEAPDVDDLVDPIHGSASDYATALDEMDRAIASLVRVVVGLDQAVDPTVVAVGDGSPLD